MKAVWWITGGAIALAGILLTGCMLRKKPENTDAIDGGVRHYTDENAPKTVESCEITSFSCRFETGSPDENGLDPRVRHYAFTAQKSGDAVLVTVDAVTFDSTGEKYEYQAPLSFLADLHRIVKENDLAAQNGIFYSVSGLPPLLGAALDITYASGETLCCANNQSCFLPDAAMQSLESLFCRYAERTDK